MHMADALISPLVAGIMLATSTGAIAYSVSKLKTGVIAYSVDKLKNERK